MVALSDPRTSDDDELMTDDDGESELGDSVSSSVSSLMFIQLVTLGS